MRVMGKLRLNLADIHNQMGIEVLAVETGQPVSHVVVTYGIGAQSKRPGLLCPDNGVAIQLKDSKLNLCLKPRGQLFVPITPSP
jgi:hypothetical protein